MDAVKENLVSTLYVDDKGNNFHRLPNGKYHRVDGPAVERTNGYKEWWIDGKLHRTDGAAIDYGNGDREWWLNGKLHRTDGAAVDYGNGGREWWLNGVEYPFEEWDRLRKMLWIL